MSVVELCHVGAAPLLDLSLVLDPGHHVLLGGVADGSAVLVELVAGLRRPRRGRVLIDGRAPWHSPKLRRRLGSLLAYEPPPAARTVHEWTARALHLRGDEQPAAAVLDRFGLGSWRDRRVESLDPAARRAVVMALSLSIARPAALALFEPLANLPGLSSEQTIACLERAAAQGTCVLSTTASPRDATRLSESIWLLDGGRIVRRTAVPAAAELTPGSAPELVVQTDKPRALATLLASAPAVNALHWDDATAVGQLRVRGADTSRVALTVLQAARQAGAALGSLTATLPALEQVHAASAGLSRGAFEQAYQLGRAGAASPQGPTGPAAVTPSGGPAPGAPPTSFAAGPTAPNAQPAALAPTGTPPDTGGTR